MEAGEEEPRRGWARCPDDRGGGRARRGTLPRSNSRRATCGRVPAERDLAPVHSEGRWKAATTGHSNGPRSRGADGCEARTGSDLRRGFSSVLVRISDRAERADGKGGRAQARL